MTGGVWFKQYASDLDSPRALDLVARGEVGAWAAWALLRAKGWCTSQATRLLTVGAVAYMLVGVPVALHDQVQDALVDDGIVRREGEGFVINGWTPPTLEQPAAAEGGAGEAAPAARSSGRQLSMKPSAVRQRNLEERRKAERQASGVRSGVSPDGSPDVRSASEPDVSLTSGCVSPDASPLDSSPPSGEKENQKEREIPGENAGEPAPPGSAREGSLGVRESVRADAAPDAQADASVSVVRPTRRQPQSSPEVLGWARAWAAGISAATGKPCAPVTDGWHVTALTSMQELSGGLDGEAFAAWLTSTATRYRRACAGNRHDQSKGFGPETGLAWLNAGEPANDQAGGSGHRPARTAPPQPATVGDANQKYLNQSKWKPIDPRSSARAGAAE